MNISISITLSEVLTQARKRLYYKGESLKEGDAIQLATTLQASQDEDDVLTPFAQSAAERMCDLINKTASVNYSFGTGAFSFSITAPANFDENQSPLIKGSIFKFMVNRVIGEWLSDVAPNIAKTYFELAMESERDIVTRIAKRKKPVS